MPYGHPAVQPWPWSSAATSRNNSENTWDLVQHDGQQVQSMRNTEIQQADAIGPF